MTKGTNRIMKSCLSEVVESLSTETYNRMEGLIDIKLYERFVGSAGSLISDLNHEGFEKKDVKEYVLDKLDGVLEAYEWD